MMPSVGLFQRSLSMVAFSVTINMLLLPEVEKGGSHVQSQGRGRPETGGIIGAQMAGYIHGLDMVLGIKHKL